MNFDAADFLAKFITYFVVWIFAVSAHEAAHAWTSYKFGDETAFRLGRVTLNPLPHIDPIGTLLLPILGFIISYSGGFNFPLIAWGKPTPVNPLNWRKKDLANVCVSLAGIVANMIIAISASIIIKILASQNVLTAQNLQEGMTKVVADFLLATLLLNVGLAIFNLLPFPPLDGSKVLQTFLPRSFEPFFEILETYGFIILLLLVQMGIIGFIVEPINTLIINLLL